MTVKTTTLILCLCAVQVVHALRCYDSLRGRAVENDYQGNACLSCYVGTTYGSVVKGCHSDSDSATMLRNYRTCTTDLCNDDSWQKSDTFECYSCGSLVGSESCNDPFNTESTTKGCAQCMKVKGDSNGASIVGRFCLASKTNSNGCRSETYSGVSAEVCYCDTDRCNVSSRVIFSLRICLGVAFLVLVTTNLF